ncbi:MAG: chemotaxis protein CheW, partial [Gammaproteobacteria bacterium]|nr:chemotaxis protein CheW [Gammaproteobacteria bacterium]
MDILRVQEIRGWESVTRIPNSPEYVRGVLNLRGSIVPIFDMRQRLGMESFEYGKDTVVIVLRVMGKTTEKNIGVVVDEVSDVLDAQHSTICTAPQFGGGVPTEYITGLLDVVQGGTSAAGGQGQAGSAVVQGGTSAAGGQGQAGSAVVQGGTSAAGGQG